MQYFKNFCFESGQGFLFSFSCCYNVLCVSTEHTVVGNKFKLRSNSLRSNERELISS